MFLQFENILRSTILEESVVSVEFCVRTTKLYAREGASTIKLLWAVLAAGHKETQSEPDFLFEMIYAF